MKHVVILFLFLCFNLLGRAGYAHASIHTGESCYSHISYISNIEHPEIAASNHAYMLTENVGLNEEDAYLITADDKEEDEDIIKKHLSLARYSLLFSYAAILNHRYSRLATPLSFCKHLSYTSSCKYIVQRALRI